MLEQTPPRSIAHRGDSLSRSHNIGEEDSCEHAIRGSAAAALPYALSGQELFDLTDKSFGVAGPRQVVGAGQFDKSGASDCAGDDPALLFWNRCLCRAFLSHTRPPNPPH